jgi:hypothetical protein
VKFLELSGVGRVMADGTDEGRASLRGWMSGQRGKRWKRPPQEARVDVACFWALGCFPFVSFPSITLLEGGLVPETCAQRTAEGGGSRML